MVKKKEAPVAVICIMPYSTVGSDGVPQTFTEGVRRDSRDPAVLRHPDFWAVESDVNEVERKRTAAWAGVAQTTDAPPVSIGGVPIRSE